MGLNSFLRFDQPKTLFDPVESRVDAINPDRHVCDLNFQAAHALLKFEQSVGVIVESLSDGAQMLQHDVV